MKQLLPGSAGISRCFYAFWLLCISSALTGQLSRPGSPVPLQYNGSKPVEIYEIIIPTDVKSKRLAREAHPWMKSEGTGYMAEVYFDLIAYGTWDTLADGTKLWRAGFLVKDAVAVNVVFRNFKLNKGVRIYLYDETQQQVLGAFSDLNNRPDGVLATSQVFGQLVIVEVIVPAYQEAPRSLTIEQIGCDFANATGMTGLKDGWYGLSGSCNEDINCYENANYQQLKHAVARIVYDGGERCTGTLVNNILEDGRDYLLTAKHCINDEQTANTAVFYFAYESPYCDGPDGSSQFSVSGATIRAKANDLDFVLLELLEPIPFYYHPYYAGWTNTGDPPESGIAIHHPRGDVKKIAIEEHSLSSATFSTEFKANTHWLVSHWEAGTTEVGSSGAAFFDQNNRIAGTLTGGQAECGNSVNDYFQKISSCWDFLSFWLDPLQIVPDEINGYDPYGKFWATGDTISNIREDEILEVNNEGLQWGSLSGHNSDYVTQFAEQFVLEGSRALFGLLLHVADNKVASASSHLTVRVWEGGEVPGRLLTEREILLADLSADATHMIQLDSIVTVSDTFFIGYQIYYDQPMDTFSLWMAGNRVPVQHNTAYVYNGVQWVSLTTFTSGAVSSSFDIKPVLFDAGQIPDGEDDTGNFARVYPNPATNEVWIEFLEITTEQVQLELFDARGQLESRQVFPPYQTLIRLNAEHVTAGVYFLRIMAGNEAVTVKLIILR